MDIREMVAVIEAYIHHRTGQEVRINPTSANHRADLTMLAYDAACRWFNSNNGRVEYLS